MKEINKLLNDFKEIVFIDFEGSQYSQEIIAIGAIKAHLDNKNFIKSTEKPFKIYIKISTPVGSFIEKLTSISDKLLEEKGVSFIEAIRKFKSYVGNNNVKYFHYGNFDMHLLHNSAENSFLNGDPFIKSIYQNSVDFSHFFFHYVKSDKNSSLSLVDALKVFHTNIEPNIHDPETDAINLMHLYSSFLTKKSILREQYIKSLKMSSSIPNPYRKVVKKLEKNEPVSYKDFLNFVDEEIS